MTPVFKPPFRSFVKKQPKALQLTIEDIVEDICSDPTIGEQKSGDLKGMWVHRFTYHKQLFLIAYCPLSPMQYKAGKGIEFLRIDFYQVGPRENIYADLKKYLKSRGEQ
jgi:Txe/YoeB family toxin of Txe-Axe toxin-antitoxin module